MATGLAWRLAIGFAATAVLVAANLVWADFFASASTGLYAFAVVVGGRFGGTSGGSAATASGLVAMAYLAMEPHGILAVADRSNRIHLVQFAALGALIAYLSGRIHRQIAALKSAEQATRAANESLERRLRDLEEFSYTVSHDLRAPLRAVEGYCEILLRKVAGKLVGDERELLGRIARSAAALDRLIEDVLTLGRAARHPLTLAAIDLGFLVEEVLARYPAPGARIRVMGPLDRVRGNESLLTQVIAHLLSNALKFVPPQRVPEIEISTSRRDGRVRLAIEDNGVGVPEEFRERIFKPFERLPGRPAREGTGIGLAIVKKAVERMDGTVGVEPAPGQGSLFWVELPEAPP